MPLTVHAAAPTETLTGIIERITFHSETTGFCVLKVQVKGKRDLIPVVGTALNLNVGQSIDAHGHWVRDRTHGLQFKAAHLQITAPSSLVGIEKYLGSGMVKGIGTHFAKKLIVAFGKAVFNVIEQEPERLLALPGIGEKRKRQLLASWQEQKVIRSIMVFLQGHGISSTRAVRVYKTYGDEAVARVQENPYRLARDVYGIGFQTADALARKLDIPEDSPLRAMAGVEYVMQNFSSEGHCAVPAATLQEKTQALLEIPAPIVEAAIGDAIFEERLMPSEKDGQPLVFLAALYQAEVSVAQHLKRLMSGPLPWVTLKAAQCVTQVEQQTGLALSTSQRAAGGSAQC